MSSKFSQLSRRRAGLMAPVMLLAPAGTSAALPELVERIKPSIVVVGTYAKTRSPAFVMRGAGFVVGNGNMIATNAHVVPDNVDSANGEALVIRMPSDPTEMQQRGAVVAVKDKAHDLALLRIEGSALPALPLQQSEGTVREGQSIAFIGFPIGGILGFSPVTHRGIISAITPIALPISAANQLNEKVISRLRSGSFDVYQLDATAYPGNSGGPLIETENGEVIGIINMVFVKSTKESVLTQPSGISFAVPAPYLRKLLVDFR